jgi:hypothetical protein
MILSSKGDALTTSASGVVRHADRFTQRSFDSRRPQPGGLSELTTLNRADQALVVMAKEPPRILLVDAALALEESHRLLLRSIPAILKTLASCADMYLHEEHGYALPALRKDFSGSLPRTKVTDFHVST